MEGKFKTVYLMIRYILNYVLLVARLTLIYFITR